MARWVVLLRGINVGGHRKLPMAALRSDLSAAGFAEVATYIQSGNVVLSDDRNLDEAGVASAVSTVVAERLGETVPVLARSAAAWEALVQGMPWAPPEDGKPFHAAVIDGPTPETLSLDDLRVGEERWAVGDRVVYLDLPHGSARTKLGARLERRIGSPITGRNWRTVRRLRGMI